MALALGTGRMLRAFVGLTGVQFAVFMLWHADLWWLDDIATGLLYGAALNVVILLTWNFLGMIQDAEERREERRALEERLPVQVHVQVHVPLGTEPQVLGMTSAYEVWLRYQSLRYIGQQRAAYTPARGLPAPSWAPPDEEAGRQAFEEALAEAGARRAARRQCAKCGAALYVLPNGQIFCSGRC